MEKTFQLDQKEAQQVSTLEQNNLRLNARYGQLRREQDDIDKRLAVSDDQQRTFITNALANRGVEQFEAAQILNGSLVARVADEPITVNGEPVKAAAKTNGVPAVLEN